MSSLFKKILVVYLLVLALGVGLSTLIYINGHSVSNAISSLVNDNLPRLNTISKLRAAIFAQKPLLYEYYATTDRNAFQQAFEHNQREIEAILHSIHSVSDDSALLTQISFYTEKISQNAEQLDQVLSRPPMNWDRARDLLAELSITEAKVSPIIEELVTLNQKQVYMSGENAQARTDFMISMVIIFSLVISIIAILIGYQVNAYLSENIERKRLAMFPERNPSPVLRVTSKGKIVYSNPATQDLLHQLKLTNPVQLLPDNFIQQLAAAQTAKQSSMEFEYKIQDRSMECIVHILADLQISHVYINDISKRKQAEEKLVHQAYHDPLTELPTGACLTNTCKISSAKRATSR